MFVCLVRDHDPKGEDRQVFRISNPQSLCIVHLDLDTTINCRRPAAHNSGPGPSGYRRNQARPTPNASSYDANCRLSLRPFSHSLAITTSTACTAGLLRIHTFVLRLRVRVFVPRHSLLLVLCSLHILLACLQSVSKLSPTPRPVAAAFRLSPFAFCLLPLALWPLILVSAAIAASLSSIAAALCNTHPLHTGILAVRRSSQNASHHIGCAHS